MTGIGRLRILQLSGAGIVSAGTGGLAAIIATARARAFAQAKLPPRSFKTSLTGHIPARLS